MIMILVIRCHLIYNVMQTVMMLQNSTDVHEMIPETQEHLNVW